MGWAEGGEPSADVFLDAARNPTLFRVNLTSDLETNLLLLR